MAVSPNDKKLNGSGLSTLWGLIKNAFAPNTPATDSSGGIMTDAQAQKLASIENKQAVSGGTAVSLVTTGDKYSWNNKASLELDTTSGSSVTKQLSPNKFYSFGTVTSLTITLATPTANICNEYLFEFDSGSTATTLSLPASVEGIDTTEIEASKHYEISIKYTAQGGGKYYGLIASW